MLFQVTKIEFDFEDDLGTCSKEDQKECVDLTMSTIWDAADEDDLVNEITCAQGWCIKSIDFRHILTDYNINP